MPTYEITDQGSYTQVLLKEGANVISRYGLPKSVSIRVRNGVLEVFREGSTSDLKIPRNFIDVPSSTNDEDLFNNLSFMSSNEGGSQPSDSFYIQLADSVADITTATQVFEIPLEVGQVALLKMEGFFQQRNNSGVVGSRLFTSAVVAGAGAISITTPSIIFSGNASLTGNIFQPNATNTGVVANALALSSGDPISWNLTLYYKIVTF